MRHRGGFTLIELLVVISIISVLMSILLPALGEARKAAQVTRDMSASRQLMTAYVTYSHEYKGYVLPGFLSSSMAADVRDEHGQPLTLPNIGLRYPWRIAPYLDYNFAAMYQNADVLRELRAGSLPQYELSVYPSMGVNAVFVGGDADYYGFSNSHEVRSQWSSFCVRRLDQVVRADRLIGFASAREKDALRGGKVQPGFHRVLPPRQTTRDLWTAATFNPADAPSATGHVDFRYDGRSMLSLMDGHVQMTDFNELRDMTRWSNQATDAEWHLPPIVKN